MARTPSASSTDTPTALLILDANGFRTADPDKAATILTRVGDTRFFTVHQRHPGIAEPTWTSIVLDELALSELAAAAKRETAR